MLQTGKYLQRYKREEMENRKGEMFWRKGTHGEGTGPKREGGGGEGERGECMAT